MKYLLGVVLSLVLVTPVYAGQAHGKILKIRSHDLVVAQDWLLLDVTTAGNCPTIEGHPYFLIADDDRGKRHLSMAMSAKLAGQAITITYDDVNLRNGSCWINYIDI